MKAGANKDLYYSRYLKILSNCSPLKARAVLAVFENTLRVSILTGHIRMLGIGLNLACNVGYCGEISLKRDNCNLHLKRLPAFAPVAS